MKVMFLPINGIRDKKTTKAKTNSVTLNITVSGFVRHTADFTATAGNKQDKPRVSLCQKLEMLTKDRNMVKGPRAY